MPTDERAGYVLSRGGRSTTARCPKSYADFDGGPAGIGRYHPCPTCGESTYVGFAPSQPNGYWTDHTRSTA